MRSRVTVSVAGATTKREATQALRAALDAVESGGAVSFVSDFEVDNSLRPKLTPRQAEVLETIAKYRAQYGSSPTQRELCRMVGLRSINGLHEHLERLVKKGYVSLGDGAFRGIRIID